ncbi:MAG: zinc-ribbon domain containing protein [Bacillota bacterium]
MSDKKLLCRVCGKEFTFTKSEQEHFAKRGFANEPRRCPRCRRGKMCPEQPQVGKGERIIHTAVCSQCGRETRVPFVPEGGRPVFCRNCLKSVRGGQPGEDS